MKTAVKQMSEEQATHLVRNALLVAGAEMGAEGDHWPVIKSTIHSVMQDWENLKVERNVDAELKTHYKNIIDGLERDLHLCPADLMADAKEMIRTMRELYDARFEPVAISDLVTENAEAPIHIKRIKEIVSTLEEENA